MWNEEVIMQKNKFGKPALALALAAASLVFPLQGITRGTPRQDRTAWTRMSWNMT